VVVVERILNGVVLTTEVVGVAQMLLAEPPAITAVLEVLAKLGTAFKEGAAAAVVPTMEMVVRPVLAVAAAEVVDTLFVAPRE
jgi:hypothetical protein